MADGCEEDFLDADPTRDVAIQHLLNRLWAAFRQPGGWIWDVTGLLCEIEDEVESWNLSAIPVWFKINPPWATLVLASQNNTSKVARIAISSPQRLSRVPSTAASGAEKSVTASTVKWPLYAITGGSTIPIRMDRG